MAEVASIVILIAVMGLLISNRVRIDLVGVIALASVGLFHLIPTHELFSGFSSYAAVILVEMFILSEGLRRSGVIEIISKWFVKIGKKGESPLISALMLLPPIPSTFISDVGLMSIFLPTMLQIRQRLKISLHRLLMPLTFSIALGGLLSMIGSAGNIIGDSTLASSHYTPIPLFGITPLGLILVILGFFFIKFWGIKHLPAANEENEFLSNYQAVKSYMSEVAISQGSPLVGYQLQDINYFKQHEILVIRILRGEQVISPVGSDIVQAGDQLIVQGNTEAIIDLIAQKGLETPGTTSGNIRLRTPEAKVKVVEAMVPQLSFLANHTLKEVNFRTRYGTTVLAILRQGITHTQAISEIKLKLGDVLLVMGSDESISRLQMSEDLSVFSELEPKQSTSTRNSFIAGGVILAVLLMAAFNFLAIEIAAAVGIAVLVLSRVLSLDQAYRAIDWRIITLVGGITPLSLALTKTGVTSGLSHVILHSTGSLAPYVVLAIFFWIAALLTQVISNVAAALVLSPLAISVAASNHWSPDGLIIAMVVALSAAPITPLANKVFIMAMEPGSYKYQDFFKIGIPFTILMFFATLFVTPLLFPFTVG